jgi:hypothetical protein
MNLQSGILRSGEIASRIFFTALLLLIAGSIARAAGAPDQPPPDPQQPVNITVSVVDSATETPLELVRLMLGRESSVVAVRTTNTAGRAIFRDVQPGRYRLSAHYVGYVDRSDWIVIDSAHADVQIALVETGRDTVQVTASRPANVSTLIDVSTGVQTFEGETYHAPPSAQITTLVQQNLAGAARASTGEVHIRGQHGEYVYYIDGIPIPLGVFGGLNEVVDSRVIDRAAFYTGGFPAEYGGQMASVIDVQTQVPAGHFHLDLSTYAGSYATSGADSLRPRSGGLGAVNSNGQTLSLSDHVGGLGFFLSGTRQESDRRIDQPTSALFHDHGFDYFLFGKANYVLGLHDYLSLNLNYSLTETEVPYDPAEALLNDRQRTYNAFQTLSFFHSVADGTDRETNFFAGLFARQGGLRYDAGLEDDPKTFLGEDTTTGYVIDENRRFTSLGFRTKFDQRLSHRISYAVGMDFTSTKGTEEFNFRDTAGNGPGSLTDFTGSDFGVFAQGEWHPLEWTRLDLGLRYDQHIAPDIPLQRQVSPRAKLNFFIDDANSLYLYYGRLFMPTNVEGLRSVALQVGDSSAGTMPEVDDFFEAAYTRSWEFGLTSKLAAFYKESTPGLDDETYGSSALKTPVNIATVKITGVEMALTYSDQSSPFSGYLNLGLIHAYGIGPVSGGFLPSDSSTAPFDLDHDQRLSAVVGLNYQPKDWFVNLVGIYGSGLTNGNEDYVFKTGLLDFNQGAHTTPSWIFNLGGGYTFDLGGGRTLSPSIYVTNIFDHQHLIKGAFFSGASFEEPRNVVIKLAYHL